MEASTNYTPQNDRWPVFIILLIFCILLLINMLFGACTSNTIDIDKPLTFSQDEIYMVNITYIYFHKDTIYQDGRIGIINYKCERKFTKFINTPLGHQYSCPTSAIEIESILMTHATHYEKSFNKRKEQNKKHLSSKNTSNQRYD